MGYVFPKHVGIVNKSLHWLNAVKFVWKFLSYWKRIAVLTKTKNIQIQKWSSINLRAFNHSIIVKLLLTTPTCFGKTYPIVKVIRARNHNKISINKW